MKSSSLLQALLVCVLLAAGTCAQAQESPPQLRLAPGDIEFPAPAAAQTGTSGVGGLQVKVLSGDPKKPGLYTLVIKAAPHIRIQPHAHPDNRVGVVVAGAFYFAHGDRFDESRMKRLPAGSFYTEPPNDNHFAMTGDEGVTLYITGTGPTGTVYVNEADDPTRR